MQKTGLLILSAMIIGNCSGEINSPAYTLKTYSGDIKVEQFDSTITNDNRFNLNNNIFTVGSVFTYSYSFFDSKGIRRSFVFTEDDWSFVGYSEDSVEEVKLTVSSGRKPMSDWLPDYDQTLISYQLSNKETFSMTGLIENEANIWMHPPREGLFRILQLSPYPTVSYPLEIGKEWEWSFEVGGHYGDKRWATWDGNITIRSTYKIVDKTVVETKWGSLECWIIEAESVSEIGKSTMKAVFNESLGFLEWHYTNIDASTITFKLKEVQQ